jgi:outer membrane protein assembly factor BamB
MVAKAKRIEIPGSSDFIELNPYDSFGPLTHARNLARHASTGESVWVAELPTSSGDAYVEALIVNDKVIGWSWSGYRVALNIESGKIETSAFTK